MLKKILTFFILLFFFFIGFVHNSMMAFAMSHNIHNSDSIGIKNAGCQESKSRKECIDTFIITEAIIKVNTQFDGVISNIKIPKSKKYFLFNILEVDSKKLIKSHSPPNIRHKNKNYSYGDLVKIIKSNT